MNFCEIRAFMLIHCQVDENLYRYMKKILAFGASNSKHSINKQLASYAAGQLQNVQIDIIDLNDYEMPIYGIDKEKLSGIPEAAKKFREKIRDADGIIVSFAEHNGAYSAAFKNIFDWASRLEGELWGGKPFFAMASSPGKRGGSSVLAMAMSRFKFMGGYIVANFSLPSFHANFEKAEGITNEELNCKIRSN